VRGQAGHAPGVARGSHRRVLLHRGGHRCAAGRRRLARPAQAGGGQAGGRGHPAALAGRAAPEGGAMNRPMKRALVVFLITAPLSPKQLVDQLLKGVADELVAVTIPEGRNLVEVTELLAAAGVAPKNELLAQATSAAFARTLGLPGTSLEGYLFPDTYRLRP